MEVESVIIKFSYMLNLVWKNEHVFVDKLKKLKLTPHCCYLKTDIDHSWKPCDSADNIDKESIVVVCAYAAI